MKRKMMIPLLIVVGMILCGGLQVHAACVEPSMSNYISTPVFISQSVKPNILILLDNSGSMNYAAYGTWPGDGGTITDYPYAGHFPYSGRIRIRMSSGLDDAEQNATSSNPWTSNNPDLDLGCFDGSAASQSLVGVRFQGVQVPRGVTITRAYIEFVAYSGVSASAAFSIDITGEKNADPVQFSTSLDNIKNRTDTTAKAVWSGTTPWVSGVTYQTTDLSSVVQEIVDLPQWAKGKPMAFKFARSAADPAGGRLAMSYEYSPGQSPLLHVEFTPPEERYYGYFHPETQYTYSSGKFVRDPAGQWNGNFMNWLCMRRIDVAKKVIMGGLATSRTGGGNQTLIGDNHQEQPNRYWKRWFDTSRSGVSLTPFNGLYQYSLRDGYLYVDHDKDGDLYETGGKYDLKIEKDWTYEPEAFDEDGNLAGVLQKVGSDKARWGLAFYNYSEGANVAVNVDDGNITNIITGIQNKKGGTWTPLAEAYYECVRYYQQVAPFYFNADFQTSNNADPFYWKSPAGFVPCGKSFVLLLTDGESTQDQNIPASLQNYAGTGLRTYSDNGTDYLEDVALWARTNDLRADLTGEQNLLLYVVYAFGKGSGLLMDAAKNGGFEDKNGNRRPDLQAEWDEDGDGVPDNYYESEDGYQLEAELLKAISDILKRAASGTAVSVLATSGEGEGNLVQAYFRPSIRDASGVTEVAWVGYLQALWVDSSGNLREDSNGNQKLDDVSGDDKKVEYFLSTTGDAKIMRYLSSGVTEEVNLNEITPLWEAGKRLQDKDPDTRKIFTYIDKNKDGVVDESTYDGFDDSGEVVRFHFESPAVANLKPYLGVADYTTWKYLGSSHNDRARNLVMYMRGMEPGGYSGTTTFGGTSTLSIRTRVLNNKVWKLGDIVNSTPTTVGKPTEGFHIIYKDESYQAYYDKYKNRETVVYVGANDGMLHAFTSWQYASGTSQYVKPTAAPSNEQIGDEIWAYVPQALLPHLKFYPHKDYGHIYYVDLKPRIFDAKIFTADTKHPNGWGTVLLCGLNNGGREICVTDDFAGSGVSETRVFTPSYFAMDVTDPRNPVLLWEREYRDLNMSQSIPAVVKVKEKWFGVFGSGPETYAGTSTKKGHVYVVDLKTGLAERNASFSSGTTNGWLFETGENNAFMNSPASLDKDLDYNVDAIYFGEAYDSSGWKGKVYKVAVPYDWASGNPDTYSDDPNGGNPWKFVSVLNATRPVTAPLAISLDFKDNVWVYVGTGRYISDSDKTNTDLQYHFGIKDPFFDTYYNGANGNYYHNYTISKELVLTDLLNATPYNVYTNGNVYNGATYFGTWDDLLTLARSKRGWYRELTISKERSLVKYALLGGIVFAPSFIPNSDICGYGGDSYLYGLYFETGTAYYSPAFSGAQGLEGTKVVPRISLGQGKASAAGMHLGKETGAKAFIQQSTGVITSQEVSPAFKVKSGLINWKEN